jgi:hypothetical protein
MTSEGESRSEVLKRIQKETQRVKNRKKQLEVDYQHQHHSHQQVPLEQESTTTRSTATNSSSSRLQESSSDPPSSSTTNVILPLLIEPSTGSYFEDPVPANQMSSHLKSEHEAFKAR